MVNLQNFYEEFDSQAVRRTMADEGYYIFDRRLDDASLPMLRSQIDELAEAEDTEINYAGSEHRVWNAQRRTANFAEFQKLSDWIMPQIYGAPYPSYTVLAIRNRPAPPQAERMEVRWHLDSFRRQLKLFAFLTDVTEETGPLEIVPRTHRPAFKLRATVPLGLYRARDILRWREQKRSWQRIHDRSINKVTGWGYSPKEMTVPAGTLLLVDTSALHRAKPCLSGERYAVTVYHR
ncbi:hypothetical protein G7A66_10135 [Altererythrobacter sp. SALINAS58]|uniref:phytanoyl-CoA dioxygenase family protein n=1 Tax=Alteripontixanthobacter muriae TaxID=2705546 RepID=UPI0015770692|nr:phytanoyl-CoA dioxygenase family protein [Alteripontixanthobacter muriae]NTZ43431.1 hypothetical protein [Alteripontixanthobacter muriae]